MKSLSHPAFVAVLTACVVLALTPVFAHAESDPADQARQVIDVRVPEDGLTQRLMLIDGSQVFGRVESIDTDTIRFRSLGGIELFVGRVQIADLRVVQGRVVNGEFQQTDTHNTRLLFAPTGRALKKGEGYFGVYEISLPFVQVGVTDRLSIGGGTPLFFGGGSEHPFWFTPKFQVLATEKTQAAIGVIHISGLDRNVGIAYGVTTLGQADEAITIGLGYAYGDGERRPILMLGAETRRSRRIKLVTENWFWRDGPGFVSGGVRFLGERLSADLGMIVPLVEDTFAFPIVSFAWHF